MADNNTPHLPPEIIELILSRLPLKSLFQIKTVCKSWNTKISDPVFVQLRHQQSKDSNPDNLFLLKKPRISDFFSLVRFEDRKSQTVRVLEPPYASQYVLCFCKGLVLMQCSGSRRIALWNPSTGGERVLKLPYSCVMSNYGLCHDPITDDFKVVIMNSFFYTVYSFKNNSWKKKIDYECFCYSMPNNIPGVCVDGASYWVWDNGHVVIKLIYFDPRDDKFKFLQKPENVKDNEVVFLADLRGSLCLHCNRGNPWTIRIWTKEKGIDSNSWETLMIVENVVGITSCSFKPLCLIGDKVLIRDRVYERLVLYSPHEKRLEHFEETEEFGVELMVPYVDSSFFPTQNPRRSIWKRKCLQI